MKEVLNKTSHIKRILILTLAIITSFSVSARPHGGKITFEIDNNAFNYDYTIYFECFEKQNVIKKDCKKFQLITEYHDGRPTDRSSKILDLSTTSIEEIYDQQREDEKEDQEDSLSGNYKSITYITADYFGNMDNGEELNYMTDTIGMMVLPFSLLADLVKSPGVFLYNQIVKTIPGESRLAKRDLEHLLNSNTTETRTIEPNEESSSSYFYYNFIQ